MLAFTAVHIPDALLLLYTSKYIYGHSKAWEYRLVGSVRCRPALHAASQNGTLRYLYGEIKSYDIHQQYATDMAVSIVCMYVSWKARSV